MFSAKKFVITSCILLVISSAVPFIQKPSREGLHAWFLNVGQGTSVLVQTPPGNYLLFDGGPDSRVLSELGEVLPSHFRALDIVALSHPHADHLRGLILVLERYHVGEIWSSGTVYQSGEYQKWIQILSGLSSVKRSLSFPQQLSLGLSSIKVLHPIQSMEGKTPQETHDGNLSMLITYESNQLLLMGDVAEKQEKLIVSTCKPPSCIFNSQVLQVAHHGSASGTSNSFLQASHPYLAVIPVGKENKFKHPRAEVLERLTKAEVATWRTDLDGRVHVEFKKSVLSVNSTSGRISIIDLSPRPAPT
jgi:competence protein ComEC